MSHTQQNPSISGSKIVWQDNRNGNEDIYMYDLVTQTETQITSNSANQRIPKISGDKIIWLDGRNHNNTANDIYLYDLTTQTETRITSSSALADNPSISGNKVVWQDWRSGRPDVYMFEIDLPPANIQPIAEINPVPVTTFGQVTAFDGSGSIDSDGTIASYTWDFGDGNTGAGVMANHTYVAAGTYQVTLIVTDDDGATDSAATTATVNAPPVASIASVTEVALGQTLSFDGLGSADVDGMIVNYAWNFGDGNTGTGAIAAHTYTNAGTYMAILTVTDNNGAIDDATISVVVDALPEAIIMPIETVLLGETTNFDGSDSNDSDGNIVSYAWNFGDSSTGSGETTMHTYSSAGSYTVTLTITDDFGNTDTATATAVAQTPTQAINELMDLVESMNLAQGISNSLDSKLQNAADALEAMSSGSTNSAIAKLEAFVNACEAQSGNQLTVEQASELIAAANRIIAAIN